MYTARQLADRDVAGAHDVACLHYKVRYRLGAAEQGVTLGLLGCAQGAVGVAAVIHLTFNDFALACPAGAIAAAVRQQQVGGERGLEHGLVGGGVELVAAGLEGNPVSHGACDNRLMKRILIVGSGDVAARCLPWLTRRFRVFALVRSPEAAPALRAAGALPVHADLDDRRSLMRLAGLADIVLHFAPPPAQGGSDPRMTRLLAALGAGGSLPQGLVYISTTEGFTATVRARR